DHAAADACVRWQLPLVVPDECARAAVDRPRVIEEPGDVQRAVDRDGRGLELRLATEAEAGRERPERRQTCDVLWRDLRERAVALAGVIARVRQPAGWSREPTQQIGRADLLRVRIRHGADRQPE